MREPQETLPSGRASSGRGRHRTVTLVRSDARQFDGWSQIVDAVALDPSQRAAAAARGRVVNVAGAPGTGKTTVAVHQVVSRVHDDGVTPSRCVLVTSSRVTAAHVRREVTRLVGGTVAEALASSMQAFGFAVLTRYARAEGITAPRLLDGAEQDVILADLLEGHSAGIGRAPRWPHEVAEALGTRGFRAELRDLLMRAVEHGVGPERLRELGALHNEGAWGPAADVLSEYDEVTALSRPGAYDPSLVLGAAAHVLSQAPSARVDELLGHARVVVVDDAQELTAAASRLLSVVAKRGVDLVLIGDPDAATQTFRGADPRLLASGWDGVPLPEPLVLSTRWRQDAACAAVTAKVSDGIGVIGTAGHRLARAVDKDVQTGPSRTDTSQTDQAKGAREAVTTLLADTVSAEEAQIAALLRREHLLGARPWSDMAVIVRGAARTSSLRRALSAAGVPMDVAGARLPLRDETAVRPLLDVFGVVLHVATAAADGPEEVREDGSFDRYLEPTHLLVLDEMIGGPLVESDAVGARRARRALVRLDRAAGGTRRAPELVGAAVLGALDVERLRSDEPDLAPVARLRRIVRAGTDAARAEASPLGHRWAPGVTAHSVLWALWQAADVAETWRENALTGGVGAERADRDLDAVVALFRAAETYVQRLPSSGPEGFLEHVLAQDVAADSLAARGQRGRQVALTTPAGAVGREWGLVVVAGLQDGVWPDSRLRGSLLGSERLVDVVTGRGSSVRAQLIEVLQDEARLFCSAVGRARERLVCTAVTNDDEQPSPFLALVRGAAGPPVSPGPAGGDAEAADADGAELMLRAEVPRAMSMTGLVGELRRRLAESDDELERSRHAGRLAALARAGVPGADPLSWWPHRPLTRTDNVLPDTARVRISPSRMQTFTECPLRWFLTAAGGERAVASTASAVGSLVHDIAAHHEGDFPAMEAELEARWAELELPLGWPSQRLFTQARSMIDLLARYQNSSAREGWTPAAKEIDIRAAIGRADIRGRIDRLERDGAGRLRVIDLKTGRTKPSAKDVETNPQLAIYQAAMEAGAVAEYGEESAGAALVQIGAAAGAGPKVQAQAPLADHENPAWAHELIAAASEGMVASEFPAQPGEWCRVCSVRSVCPAQTEGETL